MDGSPRKRVLVVSHEATRTGAPKVAVEAVRALHYHGFEVVALLRAGGPLTVEFRSAADRLDRERLPRLRAQLRRPQALRRRVRRVDAGIAARLLRRWQPDLVYLNTVVSAVFARPALALGIPTVVHLHELDPMLGAGMARYQLAEIADHLRWVACSGAVRNQLVLATGLDRDRVEVVPSPVDAVHLQRVAAERAVARCDRQPIVGACGTADVRKGVDLWLEMAALMARNPRQGPPVRFVWAGRTPDREPRRLVSSLGLNDRVQFTGELEDPSPLLAIMDVFTLPSRSDPFPLVVLEAMALGRPIVAFDVGGVAEQLADTGVLVAPGDVTGLAREVQRLLDDPEAARQLGDRAASRVRERFGVEGFRAAITGIVERSLP
ncbi:MAG: glycosyltransferase [Actinomycetota bacterium]